MEDRAGGKAGCNPGREAGVLQRAPLVFPHSPLCLDGGSGWLEAGQKVNK